MRKLAAGNWKMNGTSAQLAEVAALLAAHPNPVCEMLLCPPATLIARMAAAASAPLLIGGQDCHANASGAHTGDISAAMLVDAGASHVILGHSERREGFGMAGEDSDLVARKAKIALAEGLKVMFCIGEKKEERENGTTMDVCASQMKPLADILSKEEWANVSSEFSRAIFLPGDGVNLLSTQPICCAFSHS